MFKDEKMPLHGNEEARCEEARSYVKYVLVREKGLRLVDVAKLVGCGVRWVARLVSGEIEYSYVADKILAFRDELEGNMDVSNDEDDSNDPEQLPQCSSCPAKILAQRVYDHCARHGVSVGDVIPSLPLKSR